MIRQAIYHKSDVPFAYPLNKDELHIVLRTASTDIKRCYIFYRDRYDWMGKFKVKEMFLTQSNELFDYYVTTLKLNKKFVYFFYLISMKDERVYYTESGFYEEKPENSFHGFFQFPYICDMDVFLHQNGQAIALYIKYSLIGSTMEINQMIQRM